MRRQYQLIEACRQGNYEDVYELINFPEVNIDDRGYQALKAAIATKQSLITGILLNDSRTDPNHFNGQLFVDSLNDINIVKQFLSHPKFTINTVTIADALYENQYDIDTVSMILDDPRLIIDRQRVLPGRKLRINDVAAMDEETINEYGITTDIRRLDDHYLSIPRQQHLAIDDLRYQLISKLYEEGKLDDRDADALESHPDLFRLFQINRFMVSMTLDIGAVMVFSETNRYHDAMIIVVALENQPLVLKSLLTSVPLFVAKQILFWKTDVPVMRPWDHRA